MARYDEFTTAYIEAALWASMDNSDESTGGEPLDTNYGPEDIAPETLAEMVADCASFQESNARVMRLTGASDEWHGHDFWLTRNRHGAGFWDRGYRFGLGDHLSEMARPYGEVNLYVGDDGQIWA